MTAAATLNAHDTPMPPYLTAEAALFLDFDGTLVAIAPRPQDVEVPSWVVPTLTKLQPLLGGALAIVSGRPLAQIDGHLRPLRLPAAGVHGVERRLADGRIRVHAGAPPPDVVEAVNALASAHSGLMVERKPGGLALHYRAAPEWGDLCRERLTEALVSHEDWMLMPGHAVLEVKQRRISKGSVLHAFMAESAFADRTPVYVGDDVTDEDAIGVAQQAGGFGIKVGGGQSAAHYRLSDTHAVGRWLVDSTDALAASSA